MSMDNGKKNLIKCVHKPTAAYITEGEIYEYSIYKHTVSYHRVSNGAGSFVSLRDWNDWIAKGWIVNA